MESLKVWRLEDMPETHFHKFQCKICQEKLWKCPECGMLLREIARHKCRNRWMDMVLYVCCPHPEPNNIYGAIPSEERCTHALKEIPNMPVWD